jgi:hypothetical protein
LTGASLFDIRFVSKYSRLVDVSTFDDAAAAAQVGGIFTIGARYFSFD